jgi:carbon monoxide dehydrogenase subunit G
LHSKEKGSGRITGEVQGANVSIDIQGDGENKTHVKVSTRKYFIMPKEQLSAGIIYEISARLRPGE